MIERIIDGCQDDGPDETRTNDPWEAMAAAPADWDQLADTGEINIIRGTE